MKKLNLYVKRLIDILGSGFGLFVLFPLLILIAISIKLSSKGPILFKQKRLGYRGKVFNILKFRTMIVDAEKQGDGICVNESSDNRIIKVGRFLRKTSLDELPQLINVFIGDMSLVGPRPPVIYHPYNGYRNYPEWAKKRFDMKPGMTGLVQVTVRNEVPWTDRIAIDNEYIDKFNVLFDIKILIGTIKEIFISKTF